MKDYQDLQKEPGKDGNTITFGNEMDDKEFLDLVRKDMFGGKK